MKDVVDRLSSKAVGSSRSRVEIGGEMPQTQKQKISKRAEVLKRNLLNIHAGDAHPMRLELSAIEEKLRLAKLRLHKKKNPKSKMKGKRPKKGGKGDIKRLLERSK